MLGQRREDKLDIRDSEQGEVKAVEDQTPRICCIDTKPVIAGTVKSAHSKPKVNQTKQTPFSPLSPSATTFPPYPHSRNHSPSKPTPQSQHPLYPPPPMINVPLSSAAAPLVIEQAALLHAVDAHVLAPLAAVLLALGAVQPAAVAGVVAGLALDELGEVGALGGLGGGRGEDGRDGGEEGEDGCGLHFEGWLGNRLVLVGAEGWN